MRKEYKNREKEKADKESLVTMQQLKLNTGAINRLTDVQMKPTVGGRGRRSGTLELHKNGLRYKSSQNAPLDITYADCPRFRTRIGTCLCSASSRGPLHSYQDHHMFAVSSLSQVPEHQVRVLPGGCQRHEERVPRRLLPRALPPEARHYGRQEESELPAVLHADRCVWFAQVALVRMDRAHRIPGRFWHS